MGEVVSLSKHRKLKQRAVRQKQAEANRVKHGRTKPEKLAEEAEAQRADEAHALLKFEPPAEKPKPDDKETESGS